MLPRKKDNLLKRLNKHQSAIKKGTVSHLDLQGADLRFSNLRSVRFEFVNLTGTDLSHSKLVGCQFVSSSLNSVNLNFCDLSDCQFQNVDVTGLSLSGSDVHTAEFTNTFSLEMPSQATQSSLMVSIYMPTWNREKMAMRAIQSVLEQTYPFWELIIVDDNSPENSQLQAFINATADPRIHYIYNDFKSGACSVRNQAIEQAKGKYIAGIDDDDEWLPNRLTTFMKYHYLLAGFSFLYADDFICEGESYSSLNDLRLYPKPAFSGSLFQKRNIIGNQIFTCTDRLKPVLFDETLTAAQDYDAFYRLQQEYGRPYKINLATQVLYVDHGEGRITQSGKKFSGYFNFYRKHQASLDISSRKYQLFTFYVIRNKKMSCRTLLRLMTLRNLKRFITGKLTLRIRKY